jgi:tetratricopeptide (TPR) repeat protein
MPAAGRLVVVALLSGLCACARPPVRTAGPSGPGPAEQLAAADRLVRAGCFDCLASAYKAFTTLRSIPTVADAASAGAARAATLLAIRERDLGTEDSGYLTRARDAAAASATAGSAINALVEIADTLPVRGGGRQVADDVELARMQTAYRNKDAWLEQLRAHADEDALSASLWLGFNCAYVPTVQQAVEQWLAAIPVWRETALVRFKAATCGSNMDRAQLTRLLDADPRFLEIHYYLGLTAAFGGRVDLAMDHLLKAYEWRARWPSVTHSLGTDYMTLEEFSTAVDFFDRTLAVVPQFPDALLDKTKALTYAGRYPEALETVDRLLALGRWRVGDARYWRALNESQLGRLDEAWDDIERANALLINADVPKLAGIIAYRRTQREVAREKFDLSRTRNPNDCETGFYLGVVLAEQAAWPRTADVLKETIACFEKAEVTLLEEIAAVRASKDPPERQARQIRKREQQIANNRRMTVTSLYNSAVACYNLSRREEARQFAARIVEDEQFGERAKEILARLAKTP